MLLLLLHCPLICNNVGCYAHFHRRKEQNESLRQDISYILERIQEDLLKGFLVVPLRDEDGIRTAAIINKGKEVQLTDTCPRGSYRTTRGCSKYTKVC